MELARAVRFCINPVPGTDMASSDAVLRHNTFAGWPSMIGLGAWYEMEITCRGEPDPATGYLINISRLDDVVRTKCLPIIHRCVVQQASDQRPIEPGTVLARIMPALQADLRPLIASIRWRLSPYYSVAMSADATDRVSISQQFEFSASHRLHVDALSAEQNREVFGKCNNPHGHGHNYRVEPVVSAPLHPANGATTFTLNDLERIVDQTIIQRFDHKHLNLDTEEFASVNPSVENIARVCHQLLIDPISQAGAVLQRVSVWETEKTRCTYPA